MFVNKGYYNTSTDYKKLFDLLCEKQTIVCLVADYSCGVKTDKKQICKANRWNEFNVNFSTPGIEYLSINPSDNKYFNKSELELFETLCKEHDVEWITNCSINEKLIAAAPELLELIMIMKEDFTGLHYQRRLNENGEITYQKILDVIKKATE